MSITPGLWQARKNHQDEVWAYRVQARDGDIVACVGEWPSRGEMGRFRADARLIAAAPELLELAESVAASGELAELGARACELIAKVESRKLTAEG